MRKGIMLCYPFDEKRLKTWSGPYIVQPKLDGERARIILDPSQPFPSSVRILSSEENEVQSVPHLLEPFHNLAQLVGPMELDGELYNHSLSFEEIHSIVGRTVNISRDHEMIQFHCFDLVDLILPQWERLMLLTKVRQVTNSPEIVFVKNDLVESPDEIMPIYESVLTQGFEGIVVRQIDAPYVRKRSTKIVKFKPKKDDLYAIVGYKQMVDKYGQPKQMLGALCCIGSDGSTFDVGSGLNDEFRRKYWPAEKAQELVGKMVRVKYQHKTSAGQPRFPVFVEVVEPLNVNPLL